MGRLLWKRIYDSAADDDGLRILVDRLWPRGISRARTDLGEWAKQITPSRELRQAYHEERIDHETFAAGYKKELDGNPEFRDFAKMIKDRLEAGNVTLVYASKTPELSHIPILREYLEKFMQW